MDNTQISFKWGCSISIYCCKIGTKHDIWNLDSAEGLAGDLQASSIHHGSCFLPLLANERFYRPRFFSTGESGDVLSILIYVSIKSNRRQKKYSPLPVYLYLLGLLLTDTQSNLELGLFIHLHGRRWLGSSSKFIMLLNLFNVPCLQKASEEHVPLNDSPS